MNIMPNNQEIIRHARLSIKSIIEDRLRVLDECWAVVEVVLGVDVEICDVVAEFAQVGFAAAGRGAGGVGWAHVGRNHAEDVAHGHFELVHLVAALGGGYVAEVSVGPGVACYLVAVVVHSPFLA